MEDGVKRIAAMARSTKPKSAYLSQALTRRKGHPTRFCLALIFQSNWLRALPECAA
jgi:hypothetical protein